MEVWNLGWRKECFPRRSHDGKYANDEKEGPTILLGCPKAKTMRQNPMSILENQACICTMPSL